MNKWRGFEEANEMDPDLKIHPAFKAGVSIQTLLLFHLLSWKYVSWKDSPAVTGIRNQPGKQMYV